MRAYFRRLLNWFRGTFLPAPAPEFDHEAIVAGVERVAESTTSYFITALSQNDAEIDSDLLPLLRARGMGDEFVATEGYAARDEEVEPTAIASAPSASLR